MRRLFHTLLLVLLALGVSYAEQPGKYLPKSERKKEKYATPEPGTYLKPVAYSLLIKMNKAMQEPDLSRLSPLAWRPMATVFDGARSGASSLR